MTPLEEFWVDGAEGAKVQSFMIRPPNFTPGRKYPVLMLIHGGPQGFWGHAWTYRWNAQVFAAAGYVVVMPNPRGSTGYGQKFIDEINSDWGGRASTTSWPWPTTSSAMCPLPTAARWPPPAAATADT